MCFEKIMREAILDLKIAENIFQNVSEKELIDIAIYRINIAEEKINYARKKLREKSVVA